MSVRGAAAERLEVEGSQGRGTAKREAIELTVPAHEGATLRECAEQAIRRYFMGLRGTMPSELHDRVLAEVEGPLLQVVLEHTRGNQSRAAAMLGINRSTLRKKLRQHGLHN